MQVAEYERVFRDGGIRALLNWDALRQDDRCRVEETFTDSREALGELVTVWYVTPAGAAGEWSNPEDRPVAVREAGNHRDAWPADRRQRLDAFAAAFAAQPGPVQLVLPTYRVGDRLLLLDGTHRAVSAYEAGVQVRLLIFVMVGPVDPSILPDLRHFASASSD